MGELLKRATFKATNSHQLAIVIVPIIMVLLATLCVALRFRARRLQKSKIMFDDWLCVVALILTWVFQAVNMAAVFVGGAGLPIMTVAAIDPNAIVTYLKIIMANFLLWVITVSVVQLSILFFYIRLFGVVDIFRYICYVFIALITMFGIAGFFSQLFSCVPVSKSWAPKTPGTCVKSDPYCSAIGIIHVAFDLGIVALPLPLVWKLQLVWQSKVVLTVLICLGLVASIISLIKIVCLFDLTGIPQEDITDYLWLTILLQTLELPIGIICCCVPSLKPVYLDLAPRFQSISSRLLSYARSNRSERSYPSGNLSTAGSKNSFARLEDNQSASGESTELPERSSAPKGTGIEVISSYSVRRQ